MKEPIGERPDMARIDTWVDRYKFEVTSTLALSVIERADEFALRATRWRLDR